jgi:hypothetical protein
MARMNPIERALLGVEVVWDRNERKAQEAEKNLPAFGEEKMASRAEVERQFKKQWKTMNPEQRRREMQRLGGPDAVMAMTRNGRANGN